MNMDYLIILGGLGLFLFAFRQHLDIVFAIVVIGGAFLLFGSHADVGLLAWPGDKTIAVGVIGSIVAVWFCTDLFNFRKARKMARNPAEKAWITGGSIGSLIGYAICGFVLYVAGKVNGWW